MYSVLAYFISRNVVELGMMTLVPILNALIVYWMIELHSGAGYFFMYMLIFFVSGLAGNSYGFLISSLYTDTKAAVENFPLLGTTLIVFSGYIKDLKDLPGWITWVQYISPMKYSFTAFAVNEYRNTTAPIDLLGFNTGLALSLILLVVLSVATRLIAYIVLSLSKTKLE